MFFFGHALKYFIIPETTNLKVLQLAFILIPKFKTSQERNSGKHEMEVDLFEGKIKLL